MRPNHCPGRQWRQGGPIEFADPEARQSIADYLTKYVVQDKYDGISFLTYAENFSQGYEVEFGHSGPIVEECRKKYGVDIRRDEFDRDAWRQMRGSHATQFLRLLKKQLAAQGKQIAVCVHGQHPVPPLPAPSRTHNCSPIRRQMIVSSALIPA